MSTLRIETLTFCGQIMPFEVDVKNGAVTVPDHTKNAFHEDVRQHLYQHAVGYMALRVRDRDVMKRAFELVADADDWKNPINARFHVQNMIDAGVIFSEVILSIEYYTATLPFWEVGEDGWYEIKAEGYRRGPAGDH